MKVSIIIVNYNGKSFLEKCIDSIKNHVLCEHEIIIVDNCSVDGSVEFLHTNYPAIKLVESEVNLGFTKGNNLGVRYASGEYLLLLNNDTEITGSIAPLLEILENDKRVGVLGCRLLYGNGTQQESVGFQLNAAGLLCSWTPLSHFTKYGIACRRTIPADSDLYNHSKVEVEWVSGAFLLTRSDLWDDLGGLDEHYFMYMEDADYCRRVSESGRLVVYSAATEVRHFEGSGRPWIGECALKNTADSYLVYVDKYYGSGKVLLFSACLSAIFLARGLVFFILSIISRDKIKKDQARAYARVALSLPLRPKGHRGSGLRN